jgi:hypothetical protein
MSLTMSRQSQPQLHRPRRSGRWSPPLWGCYEYQTSGSEHDSECETCSGSDNESASESGEREREINGSEDGSDSDDDEDEEERARKMKEKRKGKQPEGIVRRKERVREPVYRPILTIRRSEGFVWNQVSPSHRTSCSYVRAKLKHEQDLFLPSYIRDRCKPALPVFDYVLYFGD